MQIPETENKLLFRTDFSDEQKWLELRAAAQQEVGEFRA